MRASELIGQDVVDAAGRRLGIVTDLRCVQDGLRRGHLAGIRVDALVVSRRHTGSWLGYDRRPAQGPWLVRAIVQLLHRNAIVVPWADVDETGGPIRLRTTSAAWPSARLP
jgi:sporulation protein YlmC with PRC-barrel domain